MTSRARAALPARPCTSPTPKARRAGRAPAARGGAAPKLARPTVTRTTATASSIVIATRGGTATPSRMIAAPAASRVKVWPSPHRAPSRAAADTRPVRAAIAATATT